MDGIRILQLGPEDHDILLNVEEGLFDGPLNPAQVFQFLAQGNHLMVLAMAAGKAVGMAGGVIMMHPDKSPQLFINEVGVRDAWQRKGIGRALVLRMRELADERGCTEVWVATETDNCSARGLYSALKGRESDGVVIYDWSGDDLFV